MITPLYAALLALFFVALSVRTLLLRRRKGIALGTSGDETLTRAMRVHSNFAEYTPIALLLMFFLEQQAPGAAWIHVLGVALLVGRMSHAWGVSQANENYRFRVAGMALTFFVIISAALRLLAGALFN